MLAANSRSFFKWVIVFVFFLSGFFFPTSGLTVDPAAAAVAVAFCWSCASIHCIAEQLEARTRTGCDAGPEAVDIGVQASGFDHSPTTKT